MEVGLFQVRIPSQTSLAFGEFPLGRLRPALSGASPHQTKSVSPKHVSAKVDPPASARPATCRCPPDRRILNHQVHKLRFPRDPSQAAPGIVPALTRPLGQSRLRLHSPQHHGSRSPRGGQAPGQSFHQGVIGCRLRPTQRFLARRQRGPIHLVRCAVIPRASRYGTPASRRCIAARTAARLSSSLSPLRERLRRRRDCDA
jgi:hypothetical protein